MPWLSTRSRIAFACTLFCATCWAQFSSSPPAKPPAAKSPAPKLTAAQKQALDILQTVEGQLGQFSPETQSHLLLEMAHDYKTLNQAKAVELLQQALAATADMPEGHERRQEQSFIFQELYRADPNAIEAMQYSADTRIRTMALQRMIAHAIDQGHLQEATQRLVQWDSTLLFPYWLAAKLFTALPAQQSGERQAIFSTAVTSYGSSTVDQGLNDEMAKLILAASDSLPHGMIVDAVDLVLDTTAKSDVNDMPISISGKNGQASFDTLYSYRLFQLLPVLQKLDPAKAESLLREHSNIAALMKQYPKGVASVSPDDEGLNQRYGDQNNTAAMAQQQQQERMADAIVHSSASDLKGALASAQNLSNSPPDDYELTTPRCEALERIADEALGRKNSSAALQAASALVAGTEDLKPLLRAHYLVTAAAISAQAGDPQSARQYLSTGMKIAGELYRKDAFDDPPNSASKTAWPSTAVWKSMLVVAARIQPDLALQQAASLPDPEIEAMEQVAIAGVLLQEQPRFNMYEVAHNGKSEMMGMFDIPWWKFEKTAAAPPSPSGSALNHRQQ